ncbi:metal ABC transporter permease [Engelhardtia mirabilis]|uniref:High-affinity zinc uptake system membrane protein ZnuB n=1 Tax=Engelhardtia mirabilis TaxID=2528011 RepID=A0A518BQC5_9BACT|nr:High-affinity zinc uptake system membrane protein ZnuB [Planctomycetes bacterium Pla133]QDV03487.1 High-affinity zinc uptake system membrane protein ZnuB [Planctomycetes bacterium Pla86]
MSLPLILELFGPAIVATLLAALLCPAVGALLFVRRSAFHGVVLPQVAAAGTAAGFAVLPWWTLHVGLAGMTTLEAVDSPHALAGYLLGWAFAGTALGLGLLHAFGRREGADPARLAVLFAVASALTTLCALSAPVGGERIDAMLKGEILTLDWHAVEVLGGSYALVALLLARFGRELWLVGLDPELAQVLGFDRRRLELIWLGLVGITVAIGSLLVGPVVLFGLLVIPPLAARQVARSLRGFQVVAVLLGFAGAVGGLALSFWADWPLGPSVVVACALCLPPAWAEGRRRRLP